jgi:polysaccharide deacetylase family protein (PEP-CTERM system associated)
MVNNVNHGPPVISIDVEDWPQSSWDRNLPVTERSAANTRRLLNILSDAKIRATMFILGKFAETFPDVVREIHAAGHEVASHGYGHVEIFKLSPKEFRDDIRRSKSFLEQLLGVQVRGYRAPDFSIVDRSLWALEVLAEEGFEYDSSIYPVRRPRYGIPDWPREPRRVTLPTGRSILEFPLAAWTWLGRNWPVAGGGYHRLLPGPAIRLLARRVLATAPYVYYCHPYEFDPAEFDEIDLPIPWKVRKHQGLGRRRFAGRFKAFVREFGGRPFCELIGAADWLTYCVSIPETTAATAGGVR